MMKNLQALIKRMYRLSLGYKNQNKAVWEDLKKLMTIENWQFGVFEHDKTIEAMFQIAEEQLRTFYYMIYAGQLHSRVKILDGFPTDLTTDMFILATHFNNMLNSGVVVVNVQGQFVEYHLKTDLLLPLLYPGETYIQINRHYNVSKDIFWAYQRLIEDNEAPALIIADLLKNQDTQENSSEAT